MNVKAVFFALFAFSGMAQADLVATDWKTSGDALATLHEETGIEWLDLTQTDGMSIQEVIDQTNQGGTFEGWRLPTFDEIDTFVRYAFNGKLPANSTQTQGGNINEPVYRNFTDIMGLTHTAGDRRHSLGLGADDNGSIYSFGVLGYTSGGTSTFFRSGHSEASYTFDTARPEAGVYLVSDGGVTYSSINDPTLNARNPNAPINNVPAMGLAGLAFAGLAFRRKKQ